MEQFKTKIMAFRIRNEKDYETIKNKIISSGMNSQHYLLSSALGQQITNTEGLKMLIPEIKRIGNNINQIAKRANENDHISAEELEEVRKEMDHIWQLLKSQIHTAV